MCAIGPRHLSVGRASEAIEAHQAALKQLEAKLAHLHAEALAGRDRLASLYFSAGRAAAAIEMCEADLKQIDAKLVAVRPDTTAESPPV